MAGITADAQQKAVREKLNYEKVKLWLPPYTTEQGEKGEEPKVQDLISRYSADLNIPTDDVASILETLRQHALEKLAAREKFQSSGVATLKVKLAGQLPDKIKGHRTKQTFNIEVNLKVTGSDLKRRISSESGVDPELLKLISGGHVIEDDRVLDQQNMRNGSQVMAVFLSVTEGEARRGQERVRKVTKTREAAELLSDKINDSDPDAGYYLQIADQTGKPLELPQEESKALALAMTLHEKGRAALKRKDHGEAILLLLEADKEFNKCRADILNAVDNYAILCLDIVWCYLCLKNVDELPDAGRRLKACEECFERSYGRNLERLAAVKGGTGTELVLFMKLHLLQAVLAFHQHHVEEANRLLLVAESELSRLRVDDDKLTQVMSMGFQERESRLALRASDGVMDRAVTQIMKRREEKEERKKNEKEEKRKKQLAKSLGKTADGQWVNVDTYNMLLSMGFPKGASRESLRQSNNNLSLSLEVLEKHPELLSLSDPDPTFPLSDEMIAQITSMGFNADIARQTLQQFGGSVQKAIDELLKSGGLVAAVSQRSTPGPSTSTAGATAPVKSPEELQREKEAIEDIMPDIPQDEEEHLDLSLEEEMEVLQEYKTLLESIR